jgi:hypothetical protein
MDSNRRYGSLYSCSWAKSVQIMLMPDSQVAVGNSLVDVRNASAKLSGHCNIEHCRQTLHEVQPGLLVGRTPSDYRKPCLVRVMVFGYVIAFNWSVVVTLVLSPPRCLAPIFIPLRVLTSFIALTPVKQPHSSHPQVSLLTTTLVPPNFL